MWVWRHIQRKKLYYQKWQTISSILNLFSWMHIILYDYIPSPAISYYEYGYNQPEAIQPQSLKYTAIHSNCTSLQTSTL